MNKIKVGDKFQIKSKVYRFNGAYRKLIVTRILDTGFDFTDEETVGTWHSVSEFMSYDGLEIYRKLSKVIGI